MMMLDVDVYSTNVLMFTFSKRRTLRAIEWYDIYNLSSFSPVSYFLVICRKDKQQ